MPRQVERACQAGARVERVRRVAQHSRELAFGILVFTRSQRALRRLLGLDRGPVRYRLGKRVSKEQRHDGADAQGASSYPCPSAPVEESFRLFEVHADVEDVPVDAEFLVGDTCDVKAAVSLA